MRLIISLLGTEVLNVEFSKGDEPDRPQLEADGGGSFEMGFQPSVAWSPTKRDAEGP